MSGRERRALPLPYEADDRAAAALRLEELDEGMRALRDLPEQIYVAETAARDWSPWLRGKADLREQEGQAELAAEVRAVAEELAVAARELAGVAVSDDAAVREAAIRRAMDARAPLKRLDAPETYGLAGLTVWELLALTLYGPDRTPSPYAAAGPHVYSPASAFGVREAVYEVSGCEPEADTVELPAVSVELVRQVGLPWGEAVDVRTAPVLRLPHVGERVVGRNGPADPAGHLILELLSRGARNDRRSRTGDGWAVWREKLLMLEVISWLFPAGHRFQSGRDWERVKRALVRAGAARLTPQGADWSWQPLSLTLIGGARDGVLDAIVRTPADDGWGVRINLPTARELRFQATAYRAYLWAVWEWAKAARKLGNEQGRAELYAAADASNAVAKFVASGRARRAFGGYIDLRDVHCIAYSGVPTGSVLRKARERTRRVLDDLEKRGLWQVVYVEEDGRSLCERREAAGLYVLPRNRDVALLDLLPADRRALTPPEGGAA